MHFVILGAGALGSLLAAHLVRAGHRVELIARGARAELLERDGIRIQGLAVLHERCAIVREPSRLAVADVFINTVKTYDSVSGLAALGALQPQLALSVQNGVVKEEELRAQFGAAPVIGAMADFSGEITDEGGVLFSRNINLHLGELGGGASARVTAVTAAIHAAGINARAVDDIETVIWSKYCGWLALMLMAVLTRRHTGEYLQDPDVARVVAQIVRETTRLAHHRGIPLVDISPMPVVRLQQGTEEAAMATVQEVGARMHAQAPTHRLSALQDLLRGRRLELEETVGYAFREGEKTGIDMPVVATCYRLAAAINRGLG